MDFANSNKQAVMSFIDELKRRNVLRVAIAYIVTAWLLLQVADVVLNNIEAPDWVFRAILLLVALGFPFALIFAWAFELTPEGLKREHEVDRSESITHITGRKLDFIIIAVMALAIGYFAYDEFVIEPAQEEALATDSAQEIVAPEVQQSIAVLPFVNMSDDPGNEYFSDGLSEEILNLLAKIPNLKVIGRTSSFAFKGKNEDLRGIGDALGVKTVLEGSVRKSGERVRITAQLVDVSDGAHIWSDTYDRTVTDIFAVQDDVAAAIIDALQIHVGAVPTRGRPTENTAAYALFLKARAALNVFEYQNAEEILLEAIELDPNFAEAYELLAYCYFYLCGTIVNSIEGQKLMGETAAKALTLDPDLVFAQALYHAGNIETYSWLRELEAFEQAVRQQPGNPALLDTLLWDLLESGYLQEALGVAERYVELDPLSSAANMRLFQTLYAVGRTSEAIPQLELVLQLGQDFAKWVLGEVNLVEKRDDIAIAHFEAYLEQDGLPSNWVRELVSGARDPATGQAHLDRRIPQIVASMPEEDAYSWQLNLTRWYLVFGFLDRHFELILDLDLTDSTWTDADTPIYEGTLYRRLGFTAHPKYLEVVESMGLIDVWEQRGAPDFCEKVGGEWVCE
jgi:TolB-like protein